MDSVTHEDKYVTKPPLHSIGSGSDHRCVGQQLTTSIIQTLEDEMEIGNMNQGCDLIIAACCHLV